MTAQTFGVNRGRVALSLAALGFIVLVMLLSAWAMPGAPRWVCLGVAALLGILVLQGLGLILLARPVLEISPEGLTYRPFSARPVAWADISRMAIVIPYLRQVAWGRVSWTKTKPSHHQLNFALANPEAYPNHPGRMLSRAVQSMGGAPPIAIQFWTIDAAPDTVRAAIAQYWRGTIEEVHQRPPA